MSPITLVFFRLLVLTAGRVPGGSRLIRELLLAVVRRRGKMTYVTHADFLDTRDLTPQGLTSAVIDPERIRG